MTQSANQIKVYLEVGQKRTFAGALDWPGWARSGRDEDTALLALYEAGPRYARALSGSTLGFRTAVDVAHFTVVERLVGSASTDFGTPAATPSADVDAVDAAALQRYEALLEACWGAFDAAVAAAADKELRLGPRGGGRQLEGIIRHVLGSDVGSLATLGWKLKQDEAADWRSELERIRKAIREALAAAARGEIRARGPRGGVRTPPRYFVRDVAWHVLDHAWEIEDRLI
ncbi:MAG TPA: hypothetical protein VM536_09995 [Chloroflexia bacterium]|nr:hypothetical protein [Chloroflexia bacterium]